MTIRPATLADVPAMVAPVENYGAGLLSRKVEAADFGTLHHFASGMYAKQMHLKAGHTALSHKHSYDHLSILAQGVAVVEVDGDKTTYTAPACIEIKAGKHHQITAVKDVTWFCIHATDITDPERVDEVLIARE